MINYSLSFSSSSWEEKAFAEDIKTSDGCVGGCVWPPRCYTCSFCMREFRSAQALGGHMNIHRRDRPKKLKQGQKLCLTNNITATDQSHQHHHQLFHDHPSRVSTIVSSSSYPNNNNSNNNNNNLLSFRVLLSSSLENSTQKDHIKSMQQVELNGNGEEGDDDDDDDDERYKSLMSVFLKPCHIQSEVTTTVHQVIKAKNIASNMDHLDLELRLGRDP